MDFNRPPMILGNFVWLLLILVRRHHVRNIAFSILACSPTGISWFVVEKVLWKALPLHPRRRFPAKYGPNCGIKSSDFGKTVGAHGGVWECPDLFPIVNNEGEEKWVLLLSINPGGPQGGSATQYFVGSFDGLTFKPDDEKIKLNTVRDHQKILHTV